MPNYFVWHKHGEVEGHAVASDYADDRDRINEMLDDLGREIGVDSERGPRVPPKTVENFYKLLARADEKLHEVIEVTVLEAVTRLMEMKAKFNISN